MRVVTDEAIKTAADKVCEENGWNDEEAVGLYHAIIATLEALPLWEIEVLRDMMPKGGV